VVIIQIETIKLTLGQYAEGYRSLAMKAAGEVNRLETEINKLNTTGSVSRNPKQIAEAQKRLKALEGKLDKALDDLKYFDGQHKFLLDYRRYRLTSKYRDRPYMLNLPVFRYREVKDGNNHILTPSGIVTMVETKDIRSQIYHDIRETKTGQPYSMVKGLTEVGKTYDYVHRKQSSEFKISKDNRRTVNVSGQVRTTERSQKSLRLSTCSPYLFYKIGELHRQTIKVPGNNGKLSPMRREYYDKHFGYPTTVQNAISVLRIIKDRVITVSYPGMDWEYTDKEYNTTQINSIIKAIKAHDIPQQKTISDLFEYAKLQRAVKSLLGKQIVIRTLSQYRHWQGRVRRGRK